MVNSSRISVTLSSGSENMSKTGVVPAEVHEQLSKEFLPAVKDVAGAGAELLKNYLALEKSSTAYAHSLKTLSRTSKGGSTKAKEYGKELNELVNDYVQYIDLHKTCVKELISIVSKTNSYSVEEKDKLKEMHGKFQKDEKELVKQQKKGTKSAGDLEAFYETSSREFLRQQELRYKFFFEKHRKWLGKYKELAKNANQDEPKKSDEVKQENGVPEKKTAEVSVHETKAEEEVTEPEIINNEDEHLTSGGDSSRTSISSLGKLPSRRPTNEIVPGVVLLNETKLHEEQEMVIRKMTSESRKSVVNAAVSPVPAPREESRTSVHDELNQEQPRRKYEYKGPVIIPAPMPRAREPEIIHKETPVMIPRAVETPVYGRSDERTYHDRSRYAAPPPERPHYNVESQYDPTTAPAHRPTSHYAPLPQEAVVVPSMFKASDYGRTLTVSQDFNATSGEQMTVNQGDQVVLIKSGNRGWIFIQDQATQRTGWIPAPFVN